MTFSYNTSSAYDLSAYENVTPPKRLNKNELKVIKNSKQFLASAITVKNICIFIMSIVVVCLMVYNYVLLNEVTEEISALSSNLTTLRSNHVILQSRMGANLSPRAVAERAENELGLQRQDKYQTEYIYLYHEDKIEVLKEAKTKSIDEQVKSALNSAVESIKEYIAKS